jgi:hypothetical protein
MIGQERDDECSYIPTVRHNEPFGCPMGDNFGINFYHYLYISTSDER